MRQGTDVSAPDGNSGLMKDTKLKELLAEKKEILDEMVNVAHLHAQAILDCAALERQNVRLLGRIDKLRSGAAHCDAILRGVSGCLCKTILEADDDSSRE